MSIQNACLIFLQNGAVTICKTDEYVIQSVIFDKYQEHYMVYNNH